jgi:hypothetical protein
MALQDITSSPHVTSIIEHLSGEVRKSAFRTGNPHLATEVAALETNPRRIRKLSAEAAQEAVKWLDTAEAIEAVIAVETRQSVTDVARMQLRSMNVETQTSANQRNVTERTQRAVAKSSTALVLETLSGMSALDPEVTLEWLNGLSNEDLAIALVALHGHVSFTAHDAFAALVVEALRKLTVTNRDFLIASVVDNAPLCHAIVRMWDAVLSDAVAEVFATVRHAPYDLKPIQADSSAHKVWEKLGRIDLLLWSNAYPATDAAASLIVASLSNLSDGDRYAYMSATRDPQLADLLVEKANAANWFTNDAYRGEESRVTPLVNLDDISTETLRVLCTIDLDDTTMRFLLGSKAPSEVVKAAVERFPAEDFGYSLRYLHSRYRRYDYGASDDDENVPETLDTNKLVEALYKYSTSLPSFLRRSSRYSYSSQTEISQGVAVRLAEAIGDDDETWQLFWTLLQSSDAASVEQIVSAAKALKP